MPLDLDRLTSHHLRSSAPLTFTICPKFPGNIELDDLGMVRNYDEKRSGKKINYVEIGYMIIQKKQLLGFYEVSDCSFSSILTFMARNGK